MNKRRWTKLHGFVICGPIGFVAFFLLDRVDAFFRSDAQVAVLLGLPSLLCMALLLLGFVSGVIALFTQILEKYWTAFVGVFSVVATVLLLAIS
ncbi:MAG: hypothetical protein IH945_11665 [Armatimonadetes bacterium]|nr:hypothetical protein [Armatimonadota bacterium]